MAVLTDPAWQDVTRITKGLEKESLRVTPQGTLAATPHPAALGSALTHSRITTDYSEALLEFITPPMASTAALLEELERVQAFTCQQLGDELLWNASMPCMLGSDSDIPVAQYGSSNSGRMKTVYRLGLGERYGRLMQTIAGIHYNFSLDDAFWQFWHAREGEGETLQAYKNRRYFDLIRNFRRNFWLLLYLFGASPAVCSCFVKGRNHNLQPFGSDGCTMHAPFATSLRMGDLGYQSKAQDSLVVSYNDLESYVQTLRGAITQPHPDYQRIGVKDANGAYHQLNDSLLQIENEFYSTIRPKRTARSGETALTALCQRGVEYIEVRCIDINPYVATGITAEQINFLDAFLVMCLLDDSPATDCVKYRKALENQRRMVYSGRDPALRLLSHAGELSVAQWGHELLDDIARVARLLDKGYATDDYSAAVAAQRAKLDNPELVPSAQLLRDMASSGQSFFGVAMGLAQQHQQHYARVQLPEPWRAAMVAEVARSQAAQAQLEAADNLSFSEYLASYYDQYQCCL